MGQALMSPALAEGAVLSGQPDVLPAEADVIAGYEALLSAIDGDFTGKSLLVADQLTAADLEIFFHESDQMMRVDEGPWRIPLLSRHLVAREFFEPSTRTDQSFQAAAQALGAGVIGFGPNDGTSLKKGETSLDTVRTMEEYLGRGALSGLHVIRHPEKLLVYQAAETVGHPVINAGNGDGEHVTQGMLDVDTMRRLLPGGVEGKTVVVYGDMLKGRTSHSLVQLLAELGVGHMYMVAPDQLQMPRHILDRLDAKGASYDRVDDIHDVIGEADALYRMRLQLERFTPEELAAMPPMGMVTPELLEPAKDGLILMHPFPEDQDNPDFHPDVRFDERFKVWDQTHQGKIARMAILALTLGTPLSGLAPDARERILSV